MPYISYTLSAALVEKPACSECDTLLVPPQKLRTCPTCDWLPEDAAVTYDSAADCGCFDEDALICPECGEARDEEGTHLIEVTE